VTGRLRALKAPAAVEVEADASGAPVAVRRAGWPGPRPVRRVNDRWRVVDEWWRERPIVRVYYLLELEEEMRLTLYHDLADDAWFEQRD
jgi:hypothetical protein